MKVLLPRLASPVGFALALLFFLLPFVAISCEAPGLGSVEVSYTGVDLATNGSASVDTVGDFGSTPAPPVQQGENAPKPDVQVLAIITVVLLVGGLGASLIPVARTRLFGVGGAALLGVTLLIVTEAVAQSNLRSALQEAANRETAGRPGSGDTPFNINLTKSLLDDMVQTRIGFWLSLFAVILVVLYNAGVLLWPRIRAATQPAVAQGPPADAPPPQYEPPPPYEQPPPVAELPTYEPPPSAARPEGEPRPPQ